MCKDNLKAIGEGIWVLSWYMLSPARKYLRGLPSSRPLIRGQLFYGQSTSPYKLSRLNGEYRYPQPLFPQKHLLTYIFKYIYQEIKRKEGDQQ